MSALVTVLDRLLEQAAVSENKEHVLEQASYAIEDVHARLLHKFDSVTAEISNDLGQPELNLNTDNPEQKSPMPGWITGSKHSSAAQKVLRLSYWRRDAGINYVLLRTQLDSRDRPTYYDIVLGARKRNKTGSVNVEKLRHTDVTFSDWLKRLFSFNKK